MEEKINLMAEQPINLNDNKRLFKKKLSLEIILEPELETKDTSKKITIANDDIFIYDSNDIFFDFLIGGSFIILGTILSAFFFKQNPKSIYFFSIFIFVGISYLIFNILKRNKKKMIMDRKNSLLSYPDNFLRKPIVTKFENTVVIIGGTGSYGALILKFRQSSFLRITISIILPHYNTGHLWFGIWIEIVHCLQVQPLILIAKRITNDAKQQVFLGLCTQQVSKRLKLLLNNKQNVNVLEGGNFEGGSMISILG